jgi:hypothetical protein
MTAFLSCEEEEEAGTADAGDPEEDVAGMGAAAGAGSGGVEAKVGRHVRRRYSASRGLNA